jgi:tripartite-type tricarboxylate transporter receptor subunit TctC
MKPQQKIGSTVFRMFGRPATGWLSLLGLCTLSTVASADPVSEFYANRTITISVGLSAGGGYDAYARLLSRHFSKHMPGQPTVVVQNVPGGAGLTLVNSLYNIAPKDGTTFGTFDRLIPLDPLLGGEQSHFDPSKFSWVGSMSQEALACVSWHGAKVKSLKDLQTTEMLVAGTGSTSDASIYPKLLRTFLGLKLKVVNGYQGGADAILAMERGEVDGFCPWSWASIEATRPDWLRDKKINVFLQMGLHKDPRHPEVPLALDLAKSEPDREAIELMMSPSLFARPFVAPPDIPKERLEALRQAFADTLRDPAFLADAEKSRILIDGVSGQEIADELKKVYATPRDVVERVKAAIK